MYHLFVQDRESQEWRYVGPTAHHVDKISQGRGRRPKCTVRYDSYVRPIPEYESAFIKAHQVIEAETEAEAWLKLK